MSSTALTVVSPFSPAWARGGDGGDGSSGTGGAGGAGFGAVGGAGTGDSGGGGGDTSGGAGGVGAAGASGGTGGTSGSLNGGDGVAGIGGGGGGGGGFQALTTGSLQNETGTLTGGSGGRGGNAIGGAGGGGAGGYGAISSGTGIQGNAEGASILGGAGGAGGNAADGRGGNGGDGGRAVQFTGAVVSLFINSGTITGGAGGAGGIGTVGDGTAGAGGVAIFGTDIAVANFGTIAGGLSGDGVTRANAITFSGGTQNSLQITESSVIVGNVVATGVTNILNFGGSGTISFDMSSVGAAAQYQGFNVFRKGTSNTWVLTGTTAAAMAWQINGGAFAVASDGALGNAANTLTFGTGGGSGGGLRWDASFDTARTVTLDAGGGNLDTNGFNATMSGAIGGAGRLRKTGAGTLTLTGANTYQGGTAVNGGTLSVSANANLGDAAGNIGFNGGTLRTTASFGTARNVVLNGAGTFETVTGTTLTVGGTISNTGTLAKTGDGTLILTGTNTYTGATTVNAGTLALSGGGSIAASSGINLAGASTVFDISAGAGAKTIQALSGVAGSAVRLGNNSLTAGSAASTVFAGIIDAAGGNGGLVKAGSGTLTLSGVNTYAGGTTLNAGTLGIGNGSALGTGGLTFAAGTTLQAAANGLTVGNAMTVNGAGTVDTQANSLTLGGAIGGAGSLTKIGTGTLILSGFNTYAGGTTVSGGTLQGNAASLQGNITNNAGVIFSQATSGTYGGAMSGSGSLTKSGAGTLILSGSNSYAGGTTVTGGILQGTTTSLQGDIVNNATVSFNQAGNGTYAGNMSGSGALVIGGSGAISFTGVNSYTGGTTIGGGVLQGNSASLQGDIVNNGSVVFEQTGSGTYAGAMTGTGGVRLQGGGLLSITGNNLYTGPTTVTGSSLVVNGSLASTVTLDSGSTIGGNGMIGGLVSNGATIAPGNSIGTLNVGGNLAQSGGTYVVEANPQGQSDRINVTGTATIGGTTVQLVAAPGSYGNSTTYTIVSARGGVSGSYAGVTSNFAFLTPSLSYDANNVFLTLALQGNAFSGFGGSTGNQRAVGGALDQSYASATGDFATVIGALAGLNTQQGPYMLNQISGQPYADFGTANLAGNTLFMNALGQQMAMARGGQGSGQRLALAQACDVEACDGASPFSVWASGLGGFGSVQGDGNSQTFTYNLGGAAAGIDYRVMPNLLLGIAAGYATGTQWADSFQGKGWTNAVSVAAYGSFTMAGFYADLLAGYAYANNKLQRQISIPGLQPRTANGSTGANQFLGQAEIGYQVPVYAPAAASITPFARLQVMSVNQAAFSEWGANSLSLDVQQQTTNSVRSTLGVQLNGSIGLGDTRTLDMALRLGWLHEYADTARPVTAAFAGAPASAFTVYGATPQRDAAAIGFQASTSVATATQIYFRYDGDIGSGTDNHALNIGLRFSW
ncbi:autotransporter domain-containing protein [Reyranella sp.]|uniref:autotransporter domain-containing protein n=1 Tax=Reyranella sp. TaxID=1929291 RepID=UPI003BA85BA7